MKWKYTEQAKAIAIKIEANEDKKIAGWSNAARLFLEGNGEFCPIAEKKDAPGSVDKPGIVIARLVVRNFLTGIG